MKKNLVWAVFCIFVLITGCTATHMYTKQDDEVLFGGRLGGTVGSPFKFKIVEAKSTGSATPQFKQVTIKTSITNVSNAAAAITNGIQWVFRLVNEKDTKYAPIALAGNFAQESNVNPGQTVFGTITFDVPAGTYVLKVDINDPYAAAQIGFGSEGTVQSFELPLNSI